MSTSHNPSGGNASDNTPGDLLVYCMGNWSSDPRVLRSVEAALDAGYRVSVLETGHRPNIGSVPNKLPVRNLSQRCSLMSLAATAYARSRRTSRFLSLVLLAGAVLIVLSAVVAFPVASLPPAISRQLALVSIALSFAFGMIVYFLGSRSGPLRQFLYRRIKHIVDNRIQKTLSSHIRSLKPDVLYIHDLEPLKQFGLAKSSIEAECLPQVIWDAHEYYPDTTRLSISKSLEIRKVIGDLQQALDAFVAVNDEIASKYCEEFQYLPTPEVSYNAARWNGPINYDGRLHDAANLDYTTKILLFQGGLTHDRGIQTVLELSKSLSTEWCAVFMGQGPLAKIVHQTAVEFRETDSHAPRLIDPAPLSELLKWTAGATIGTLLYEPTSLNHRFASPNKLWEYAAAGVPLICYDNPWLKKVVQQHGIGWSFRFGQTIEELSEFIERVTPTELEHVRNNCRQFIESWNWDTERKKLSQVLRRTGLTLTMNR